MLTVEVEGCNTKHRGADRVRFDSELHRTGPTRSSTCGTSLVHWAHLEPRPARRAGALEPLGKFGPAAVDARGVSSQNFGVTSLVQF
jgi:hypothetical protein